MNLTKVSATSRTAAVTIAGGFREHHRAEEGHAQGKVIVTVHQAEPDKSLRLPLSRSVS